MRTANSHSAADIRIDRKLPWEGSFCRPFRSISRSSDAPSLRKSQQMMSRHEQIRQRRHNEQPVAVFHHTSIADLGKTKDTLDDEEGMLNLGTHTRLSTVLLQFSVGESLVAETFLVGEVTRIGCGLNNQPLLAGVSRVA